MQVTTEVSLQRISDLLSCALEGGGSTYWACIKHMRKPNKFTFNPAPDLDPNPATFPHLSYPLNPGGALVIVSTEEEDRKPAILNLRSVRKGLQLMSSSKTYAHHWGDFLKENEDAITGDVFLQFCLFGEVIYS